MSIYDVTEPHALSPTPDEDDFHESIEQETDTNLSHVTYRNPLPPLDIYTKYYLTMIPQMKLRFLLTIIRHRWSTTPLKNSLHLMILNIDLYQTSMLYTAIHMFLQIKVLLLIVVTMVDYVVLMSVLSGKLDSPLIFRV